MTRRAMRFVAVIAAGWLLGGAAIILAVSAGLPATAALAVAAVVMAAVAGAAALGPAARRGADPGRRRAARVRSFVAAVLAMAVASGLYLVPSAPPAPDAGSGDGERLVELRPGAVVPVRVQERPGPAAPVVAVHGGPGVPFSALEERELAHAMPDRTIVFYDQVGAGRASRAARPSDYSTPRAVADLELLMEALDLEDVVLLGFSAGATVVTEFAAEHPDRVEALLLLSAGPLAPGHGGTGYRPQSRLAPAQSAALYAAALEPRNLVLYLLTLADADVAQEFGGDAELDARFGELTRLSSPGLTCSGAPPDPPAAPLGHYLHARLDGTGDVLSAADVRRLRTVPMLLLRGACDYIPRSEAVRTASALDSIRLVDVPGAGHSLLDEAPDVVRRELRRFLAGADAR